MRKSSLIAVLFLFGMFRGLSGAENFIIRADYGQDLDPDGEFRQRLVALAEYRYGADMAALLGTRYHPGGVSSQTGFFWARISPDWDMVLGRFYVTAGSGLLLGQSGYRFLGPFNRQDAQRKGFAVTGDRSGRGDDSFQGLMLRSSITSGDISRFTFSSWYSLRNCYSPVGESRAVAVALSTLEGKLFRVKPDDETLTRHDGGFCLTLDAGSWHLETAAIAAFIASRLTNIGWSLQQTLGEDEWRRFHGGFMVYLSYNSSYFSVFAEGAVLLNGIAPHETVNSLAGFHAGVNVNGRSGKFSFKYRFTPAGWYAPLGAFPIFGENSLDVVLMMRIAARLRGTLSGNYTHEASGLNERGAGLVFDYHSPELESDLRGKVVGREGLFSWQAKAGIRWRPLTWFHGSLSAVVQEAGGTGISWGAGISLGLIIIPAVTFRFRYGLSRAAEGNGIYLSGIPVQGRNYNLHYCKGRGDFFEGGIILDGGPVFVTMKYSARLMEGSPPEHGFDAAVEFKI